MIKGVQYPEANPTISLRKNAAKFDPCAPCGRVCSRLADGRHIRRSHWLCAVRVLPAIGQCADHARRGHACTRLPRHRRALCVRDSGLEQLGARRRPVASENPIQLTRGAREDQTGKASTGDGAGDRGWRERRNPGALYGDRS